MNDTSTTTGTIEHVDPTTVIVEANVRTTAPLNKEFLASIRENGVLTPILARRDNDGNVIVRAGQRRTLAAREVGLTSIPAFVVEASEVIADRIIQQLVENEHRTALTDGDRVAAFQQLAFEGLTPQVIAKRTATKQADVKQGLRVAESQFATAAVVEHQLTFDQAATLIEFEGDDERVADLIEVAKTEPAQSAHAAQRARDDKARAEEVARVSVELREQGFTVLDRDPGYYDDTYIRIGDLVTGVGKRVTPDDLPTEGERFVFVRSYISGSVETTHFVTDYKALGFRKDGSTATSGPMTDEQKAERRELIINNKAWASAETVRREWLTTFLGRKTLPKDVGLFVARGLTSSRSTVADAMSRGNSLAHALLGIEHDGGMWSSDKLAALVEANPGKAATVTLAVVLAGIESHTSKATWRHPTRDMSAYFGQLTAWGYAASDVEQIVIDHDTTSTDADRAGDVEEQDNDTVGQASKEDD
jgi:ParB family transcriptional regulator, chromosome partitioning protein